MTMITNVQQAVYPILLICSVFGIGIYSPKKFYLNIFYNLTVWTGYGSLCYYVVTALKAEVWYQSMSNTIHIRIGVVSTVISIIMSVYQDKKFRLFMKRLTAVDDTLEELGTPKVYKKLHTYTKGIVFGWLTCSYTLNICDMIWWLYAMEDHRCLIIPYIANHYYHVNMLMDILIIIFLWHLHLELCQIARELNTIFGPQMTMEMVSYLIYVARLCSYIFMHIRTKGRYIASPFSWFNMSFWISVHLSRLFSINYICEKISAKANEMENIIHQLTGSLQYADVRDEIYQFSLQINHHPLKFTGLGLFYFGNNLIRKFVTTITAFMVIVIQISNKKEKWIIKTK